MKGEKMAGELPESKTNQLKIQEEMLQLLDDWYAKMKEFQVQISQLMDISIELFEDVQLNDAVMQVVAQVAEGAQDPELLRQVERVRQRLDSAYQEIEKFQDWAKILREELEDAKLAIEDCRVRGFKN
ncbi:hypothetical protein BDFG_08173 [Blastomyces dermatitidis ATCC 26199]|nr:hypothetical protein BDFG_08173 [Blastomyces dermatitidis ATCC 26199]